MLIKCDECGADVSDKAPSCIKCGNPMIDSARAAEPDTIKPTTIEQTGKSFKGHQLIAGVVVIVGVILMIGGSTPLGGSVMAAGAIWYLGASMGAWWGHG